MAMNKEIVSSVIGPLQQDKNFPDWWKSDSIEIPFLDSEKLAIIFIDFLPEEDHSFMEDADNALRNFLGMTINDRNLISQMVYRNCVDFLNAIDYDEPDDDLRKIQEVNDIWNFVYPAEIYVSRRNKRDKDIYISIDCDCDWEQEHGLQLVFRQGKKLTRISARDGHLTDADAYDKLDNEDELLSKF
jgi:hypothetical protein